MAIYDVTNLAVTTLESRISDVKTRLEERRALWAALPDLKRRAWRDAESIPDPILDKMWKLYQFLKEFFGDA